LRENISHDKKATITAVAFLVVKIKNSKLYVVIEKSLDII